MSDLFDFEEEQPKSQTGLWIVAGAIIAVIMVLNVWPDEEKEQSVIKTPGDSATVATVSAAHRNERKVHWPTMQFEDVLGANPFLMTGNLADALENEDNPDFEAEGATKTAVNTDETVSLETFEPRQLDASAWPVRFVFHGPRGAAAMIGDTVYYEGDELNGMRIVQIAQNGVTLCPLSTAVPSHQP